MGLIDDLQSQLIDLQDQYSSLSSELKELRYDFQNREECPPDSSYDVERLQDRIGLLEDRVENLDSAIQNLTTDFDSLRTEVRDRWAEIETRLDHVADDFAVLGDKFTALETRKS